MILCFMKTLRQLSFAIFLAILGITGGFVQAQSCPQTFSAPYTQTFDGFSISTAFSCSSTQTLPSASGWVNNTSDGGDWLVETGSTGSSNTGPTGDATTPAGTGNYLYIETSGCAGTVRELESPCFDVNGLVCPGMEFNYHMFGAAMGSFDVDVSFDQGATWTTRFSLSGNQGNGWNSAIVDLSGSASVVKVRFVGTAGTSFTSDLAIDQVEVYDLNGMTFNATFSGLPGTASITDAASSLTPAETGGTFSGPGITGGSFSPSAAGVGTHVITYTIGPGACSSTTSQTVVVTGISCNAILNFPYAEDFETFSTCVSSCGSTCPVGNGWTQDINDDMDWTTDIGGTSSSSTGPNGVDANPGTSSGRYLYTETSGTGCTNATANLLSPCVSIPTNSTCPVFSFSYHMFGATMGTMNVDISTDGGSSWGNIFTATGNQGNQWNSQIVDITAYQGQDVRFRFQALTGTSFTSDMAIDDIRVYDFTGASASFDIVHPNGNNPLFLTVLDAPATLTPSSPGGVFTITPATGALNGNILDPSQAPALVLYTITYTIGPAQCGASSSRNLFISNLICGNNVVNLPFSENFDGFSTCGTSCGTACPVGNGWLQDPNDDMDWTTDANGTGSTNTGPSSDHTSGSGNYMYTETSGASCNNATANLISPCIDLTGSTCPAVSFYYHQYGAAQGGFNVGVSTDQGNTWTTEFSSSGDQGDQWNQGLIILSGYSGLVRLRFQAQTGTTFTSDLAIDDIEVFDFVNADPSFAGLPGSGCTSQSPFTLTPAVPGGFFTVTPSTPAFSGNTFTPALASAGSYSIVYTTPGPSGCAQTSLPQTINILPPPSITASGTATICAGESATISAVSPNCTQPGQVFYNVALPAQLLTSTGQNMNFQFAGPFPTATGNGTVTVSFRGDYDLGGTESIDLFGEGNTLLGNTGAGSGQCLNTIDQVDIEIPVGLLNSWLADGFLDLIADNGSGVNSGLCGTPQDVSLELSYPAGGCGFLWSTGEVANSITVSPASTETYFVQVIDSGGCSAMDSVTITVIPPPTVDAGEDPAEICAGSCVDLVGFGAPAGAGNPGLNSITTTFANNNGAGGNMFEVTAGGSAVTITGLEGHWSSTSVDVEVFFKTGSYIGSEQNASAWTSLGRTGTIPANGTGTPTLLPLSLGVTIPAGATYSFFVHSHTGSINYTNGTTEGNIFVNDGNLSITEGIGTSSGTPFGTSRFSPRVWNGTLFYNLPGQGGGNPTVTYLWTEGSATGPVVGTTDSIQVCPGDTTVYFLTVTDSAGCSATDEVTVTVNPNPALSFSTTDVSCFGFDDGAIDMTIAGQTGGGGLAGNLTSTFAGGNGQSGNMFDVAAINDVTIDGMDVHIGSTSTETVEIWTKTGSYVGFTGNASAWTLIGSVSVTGQGAGNATPLPANSFTPVTITAGNTQAFYVTLTTSTNIDYTNGTNLGGIFAQNADLQFFEGVGNAYPFGGSFSPRVWNGTLYYNSGPRFSSLWTNAGGDTLTTDEDLSSLFAGTYCVEVTDNRTGCTTDSCLTVNEPTLLVCDAGDCGVVFPGYVGPGDSLCHTLNGSASGGTPGYTYQWSYPGIANAGSSASLTVCPDTTTEYTLTVTDANGCVCTSTQIVHAYNVSTCNANGNKILVCHVPPGNPANEHNVCIGASAVQPHVLGANGHGTCYLGPCGYDPCTGSKNGADQVAVELSSGLEVEAYPNPFSQSTTIEFSVEKITTVKIEVYSATGVKIGELFNQEVEPGTPYQATLEAGTLSDGVYLYNLVTGDGESRFGKLYLHR